MKDSDNHKKETQALLQRYFEGDISYTAFCEMKARQAEMNDEELLAAMDGLWEEYNDRNQELPDDIGEVIHAATVPKPRPMIRRWMSVAATLLLICLGGTALWYLGQDETSQILFATAGSETKEVTLPDGSTMRLNQHTEARCFASTGDRVRKVELIRGEILLNVVKDANRPFRVQVENMQIEVLGTFFNVRNVEGSNRVETTLLEGRIKLTSEESDREIFLEAGQKAIFDTQQQAFTIEKSLATEESIWNNALVFKAAPLSEVFSTLERHYGVNIHINKPVPPAHTYTSSFEGMSLADMMEILSIHFKFSYHINDKEISIDFE